jgi:hypothetical protein
MRVSPPVDPGKAFAQNDHLLDAATSGPLWLKDHRVAALVAKALDQGENEFRLYERFAWVIMPNHVHVVMRPSRPLPMVMRWIKGSTARSANLVLERTGKPFWQYETYDHCVRSGDELNRVIPRRGKESCSRRTCSRDGGLALVQRKRRPKAYSTKNRIYVSSARGVIRSAFKYGRKASGTTTLPSRC